MTKTKNLIVACASAVVLLSTVISPASASTMMHKKMMHKSMMHKSMMMHKRMPMHKMMQPM